MVPTRQFLPNMSCGNLPLPASVPDVDRHCSRSVEKSKSLYCRTGGQLYGRGVGWDWLARLSGESLGATTYTGEVGGYAVSVEASCER